MRRQQCPQESSIVSQLPAEESVPDVLVTFCLAREAQNGSSASDSNCRAAFFSTAALALGAFLKATSMTTGLVLVLCRLPMKHRVLKLVPPLLTVVLWSGCASSGPPLPPSLELPTPANDLRAVRKGDAVSLSWTMPTQTTDHESVRRSGAVRICRSLEAVLSACGTPIGTVPPPAMAPPAKAGMKTPPQKIIRDYTDNLPPSTGARPADEALYAVEVLNQDGRSAGLSNRVHVPVFPALPPPGDFHAEITSEGVQITWNCPVTPPQFADVQYRVRVSRSLAGGGESSTVAESDLMNCHAPLLDPTFEWEKTYSYHAAVVIVVAAVGKPPIEIEGDDTARVQVFAHDVFPPSVPAGLQAVFSGVGQHPFIDLVWSPDIDADLAGYNVYRHEEGGLAMKLNPELIKAPAYRDTAVQTGKKYFYAVSAVDVRGNESARSEEASEGVP